MDQETWKFINTFAPWLSAIGTLVAVFVTIYLSRRDKYVKLKVEAGIRHLYGDDYKDPKEKVTITVTNIGLRKSIITGIGIKYGVFHYKYNQIIPHKDDGVSSTLPATLNEGDYAQFFFEVSLFVETLKKREYNPNIPLLMKVYVNTSINKTFSHKVERVFAKRLRKDVRK